MPAKTTRVAAVQFATGTDVSENLITCLRMIDQAAVGKPDIIALPEFCNHSSWYADADYCYNVAVDFDSEFVATVGQKAAEHRCYIMLNCTVKRENNTVTGTNILFNAEGQIIATSDKQVLMGNENNFLSKAKTVSPIIDTPFGALGLYSCMDGVIFETPRGLALRGAHILLNSLNSFADDEASLHVPVRAAENKVFVVAANKVGSLVPENLASIIAERVKISPEQLHGAGESQIVAPDGTVLAKAPRVGEAVIYADIDAALARDKRRSDGTDIFAARRPTLYAPLANAPTERLYNAGSDRVHTGVYQPQNAGDIEEIVDVLAANPDLQLLVLPELFGVNQPIDAAAASQFAQQMIATFTQVLSVGQYLATSIVQATAEGYAHVGVILGRDGIVLEQPQLHAVARHSAWQSTLGASLLTADLPFGRVALIVGEDSIYPEVFRLAALQNVEIAIVPTHISETWELTTGLLERAAENRINIVVGSRFSPVGGSAILTIDDDFTLWTEWKHRPFDGNINYPIITRMTAPTGLLRADVHPSRAGNRLVSQKTDVVDGRPYWLLDALVKE